MPQGEGGSASREHQRAQLVLSSSAGELTSNHSLLNSLTENARGRTLAYEDLSRCFHLPINAAAKELGVCVTALKKQCRKHGVPRWPHRKLKSLDKLKEKLEKEEATAADKEYYKHEIHSIAQKKDHIFRSSAASAASAPNPSTSDPSTSQLTATAPSASAHPPQQLVVGRPVAHFHPGAAAAQKGAAAALPPHYAAAPGRNPTLVPFAVDAEKQQMVPASLVMPFSHISGAPTAPVPGPNGTLISQPGHAGQQYALCGIYGCDCYMNNGISSRMYHSPLPIARIANSVNHVASNAAGSPSLRNNGTAVNSVPAMAGGIPNVHYFNPSAAYAYGPAVAHMGPYQNMVQVNVMEQPSFPHGARPAQAAAGPGSSSVVNSSGSQSQPMMHHSGTGPSMSSASGYEVYRNLPHGANGPGNAFVYNPFVHPSMHYNGVMEHQANGSTHPGYWTDVQQHQQSTPGNLVTMCNQTVHHHHHHGMDAAATASPVPTERRQGVDNTSSKTNNSEARTPALREAGTKETGEKRQSSNAGEVNAESGATNRKPSSSSSKKARSAQEKQKPGKDGRATQKTAAKSASAKEKTIPKPSERSRPNHFSLNKISEHQSESKTAGSPVRLPNGTPSIAVANGAQGTSTENSSETSNFSARNNDENFAKDPQSRKRNNKRPRAQVSPGMNVTNAPSARKAGTAMQTTSSSEAKNDRKNMDTSDPHGSRGGGKPSDAKKVRTDQIRMPESPRKRDMRGSGAGGISSPGTQNGAAAGPDFAKRYDHVVHQCLGLQTAQWCTDLNFNVTLALGPKALLGLAGVPSLGRSVLDGTDTALENTATARGKYALSSRGQRLEWIATNGNSRYLVVMNPYRKRNSQEISGVSGLMVELKIIQSLPKQDHMCC